MLEIMRQIAKDQVWSNPGADTQFIIQPVRVSKSVGEVASMRLMGRRLTLPATTGRFHVFQAGQVLPSTLGLLNNRPAWYVTQWTQLTDAINESSLFADVYTDAGVQLPRFKTWYMFTPERALIFAVEQDNNIPIDWHQDAVYIRFYSNAFYETLASDATADVVECAGATLTNTLKMIEIKQRLTKLRAKGGWVFCFRNGHLVDDISALTCSVGDTVEYVYDASVKRVVSLPVSSLPFFTSTLDGTAKYLLHYSAATNVPENIDFQDDIDVYIGRSLGATGMAMLYHHHNVESAVRMVTHRDYSVRVNHVRSVMESHNDIQGRLETNYDGFVVRVVIRNGGYNRKLIYDANRIFELYRLTDHEIRQAMVGTQAALPQWRAENLEASAYTTLMRSRERAITNTLLEAAYGYNGLAKVLADTPIKKNAGASPPTFDLPPGLQTNSTIYEHDANGKLLTVATHTSGVKYFANNAETEMIEAVVGLGSNSPSVQFGSGDMVLKTGYGYRVYIGYFTAGNATVTGGWTDITDTELYTVSAGVLSYAGTSTNYQLMIRYDDSFLDYTLAITPIAGTLYFDLAEYEDRGFGLRQTTLPFPLGELDVWLNNCALVRDVDYHMVFPRIVITNQKFITQPAATTVQQIRVRYRGFPNSSLKEDPIDERGWVEYGMLSHNSHYDMRDDRVKRIIVGGMLYHEDDLKFSEDNPAAVMVDAANGSPYEIKDLVVPLRDLAVTDTYVARAASRVVDSAVSTFLNERINEPTQKSPTAIQSLWPVVSPFLTHVINDILDDKLGYDINRAVPDSEVLEMLKSREWMLPFDPAYGAYGVDSRYVQIRPHFLESRISLLPYQYSFVMQVSRLYLQSKVQLNEFLIVEV